MTASTNLGSRLREARRAKGISQVDAARALGVSRPTLIATEQDRREPTPTELTTMARIYGRQVHDLVRESPPLEALTARFRLETGAEEQTLEAVDTLQRVADNLIELETIAEAKALRNWPTPYDPSGLPLDIAGRQVADAERQRLGLGTGPISRLREVIEEDFGIRVFAVPLPSRVAGLFVLAEPIGACIAFNAKHPHERQRWTMAHELGHFLMHRTTPEITLLEPKRNRDERVAEAFAAHFLVPDESLVRRFQAVIQSREGSNRGFTAADLLQLASQYEVSAHAMALRLEDARLVAAGWWDTLVSKGLRVQEAKEHIGLGRIPSDKELLPRRSQYLAVEAFLNGELSEGRLARTLNSDRVTAREKVRALSGSNDIAPQGMLQIWELSPEPSNPHG